MKCILFKWVLCLLLGFSSVSYSRGSSRVDLQP
ncbi:Shiga toxin subunit A [Escherichia phage vB_EcoP_24B]|uniref:Interupted Stx2A protein n=1 Tax=Escherichia phage vB_EcoP_24B TaxID=866553 RepID=G3CFK9_9CAUD|nr:Shiga toxin subunit A [Escherichia phage vB_EcoP_24B]ADN68431.1 interupted Stx2A protein [Escherichia phage vB_EcoP_24B]